MRRLNRPRDLPAAQPSACCSASGAPVLTAGPASPPARDLYRSRLLANLRYVVVDEGHAYRGVFGCHAALVLRRLRRLCDRVYHSQVGWGGLLFGGGVEGLAGQRGLWPRSLGGRKRTVRRGVSCALTD
jgi:hypothetical protein